MLSSWMSQTVVIPMYVSISFAPGLRNTCLGKLPTHKKLRVFVRQVQKTQFQHYKELSSNLDDLHENTWVMFSDDDDIWNSNRVEYYSKLIQSTVDRCVKPAYVFTETTLYADTIFDVTCETDVNLLVSSGKLKLTTQPKDGQFSLANYINYVVSLKTFCHFVTRCSDDILKHALCDVGFAKYLRNHSEQVAIAQSSQWLYFYRKCETSGQVCQELIKNNKSFRDRLRYTIELSILTHGSCSKDTLSKGFGFDVSGLHKIQSTFQRIQQESKNLSQIPDFVY